MRAFLLAAAFASTLTAGAMAQQAYDPSPRDQPFAKGSAANDTFHLPSQADIGWGTPHGNTAYGETWNGTRIRRLPVTRPQ
jgi:hypothetical protein